MRWRIASEVPHGVRQGGWPTDAPAADKLDYNAPA